MTSRRRRIAKWITGAVLVLLIALPVVVRVVQASYAEDWPEDPGPFERRGTEVDPAALEAVNRLLYTEGFGIEGGHTQEIRDAIRAAHEAEPTSDGGIDEALYQAIPWDALEPYMALYRDVGDHGYFARPVDYDDQFNGVAVLDATRLFIVRARWTLAHGSPDDAVDAFAVALRVAERLQLSAAAMSLPMIGVAAEHMVLEELTQTAEQIPPHALAELISLLGERLATPTRLDTAYGAENNASTRYLLSDEVAPRGTVSHVAWRVLRVYPGINLFDQEHTVAADRVHFAMLVDAAAQAPGARRLSDEAAVPQRRLALVDNPAGRGLLGLGLEAWARYMDRADALNTYRDLVVLRLALAHHEATTGATATSLEELVPDSLPSLPHDQYDFVAHADPGYVYDAWTRTLYSDAPRVLDYPTALSW